MRRTSTWIGLAIGTVALLLQFYATLGLKLGQGAGLGATLVFFFTFYTILTNIMLVLVYLSDLNAARWLGWWRSPVTRGMMAGAIALVGIFNHLLLADLQDLTGLAALCDTLLHYAAPAYFVLWWLIFQPKGTLRFADIPVMLLPTLIWLIWAMLRGAVVGEYPYPILDAATLGYGAVAINCLFVFIGLLVIYLIVVALDRALAGRLPRAA
ncbi:MAG TPA: Pr6Pr family membrane protein [Devosia sp.]|nr:Pr6Pr family membrane protein [Devosia sp.]